MIGQNTFWKIQLRNHLAPEIRHCMAPIADTISLTDKSLSRSAESSSPPGGIFRDLKKLSRAAG